MAAGNRAAVVVSELGWESRIQSLKLERLGLRDLSALSSLTSLVEASFSGNLLGGAPGPLLPSWPCILRLDLSVSYQLPAPWSWGLN